MAMEAPFDGSKPYDDYLEKLVMAAREGMRTKDDDRLYIVAGPTGTGKSTLAWHIITIFIMGIMAMSMDFLALTRQSFAIGIKKLKDKFQKGIKGQPLWFDEADSDNLEQNAKWNKRLFSLYMKIRFLGGFHLWCWPSLKSVDRRFVEERVNGIFFCYTKDTKRARSYAYFPKASILRMIDGDITLNYYNLKKYIDKYAAWVGHFKDYNGPLKKEYLKAKHEAGYDSVDDFFEDFGESNEAKQEARDYYTFPELESMYARPIRTIRDDIARGIRSGLWVDAETRRGKLRCLPKKYIKAFENMVKGHTGSTTTPNEGPIIINARKRKI